MRRKNGLEDICQDDNGDFLGVKTLCRIVCLFSWIFTKSNVLFCTFYKYCFFLDVSTNLFSEKLIRVKNTFTFTA